VSAMRGDMLRLGRDAGCPSQARLDALLLDLVDPAAAEAIHQHVAGCASCEALLEEARAADAAFTDQRLPALRARLEASMDEQEEAARGWIARLLDGLRPMHLAPAALALSLVMGLVLLRGGPEAVRLEPVEVTAGAPIYVPGTRIKGGAGMTVYVKRGERILRVGTRHVLLRPGDRLRVVPHGVDARRFVLLSVSSAGQVQYLYPRDGVAREIPDGVVLPGSFILDEDPLPERLFALFPGERLTPDAIREAVQSGGPRPLSGLERLPLHVPQDSLYIEKEVGP
jgi:hypothetical protein